MLPETVPFAFKAFAVVDSGQLTREVFGNIPAWAKATFYVMAAIALLICAWGCGRRVRLWRLGRSTNQPFSFRQACQRFAVNVVLQARVGGRGLASLAHVLLFWGFLVLLIGTTLIAVEHLLAAALGRAAENPVFHKGVYFGIYEIVMDAFGIALLVGIMLFAWRRLRRPPSVSHNLADWLVLALLFTIGVTGYLIEGLRILHEHTPMPGLSFVGLACARMWTAAGITAETTSSLHFALWWFHAILALGLIAALPFLRLWHSLAGAVNLIFSEPQLGEMQPVTVEDLESQGFVGVGKLEDFTRRQLMMMDACVSCGRCEEACPAFEAGKPLSPKQLVQDLHQHLNTFLPLYRENSADQAGDRQSLHGETIEAETLWSCTTCSACVDVCPLGVHPLGMITDMRRFLVGEAELRGAPANALQKSQRTGNPWGLPREDRLKWADGLNVPTVDDNPDFEVLYWIGCAASYDRRIQKVARAVVTLLRKAEVNFAVLGQQECCTGDSARRMGDEFLFQELAQTNLETFSRHNVRNILTHCPHCLNSLTHDYVQFGGDFKVVHHSEFLRQLIADGRLPVVPDTSQEWSSETITYHDPCYLARVNGQTQAPREVLRQSIPQNGELAIIEMPRHGRGTSCCGAGGGRMWFDDAPDERIGGGRIREALDTKATTVAVSCPFCLTMMSDGIAAQDNTVQVKDIAELLVAAIDKD